MVDVVEQPTGKMAGAIFLLLERDIVMTSSIGETASFSTLL